MPRKLLSALFGGRSQLMTVLVMFIVIDFFSGLALAAKEGRASSMELWLGVTRKIGTLGLDREDLPETHV